MYWYKLLLFLVFNFYSIYSFTANIKGKINLDESWANVIYISVIHSFDDLHTASFDFLRYQTEIDSTGYFEFNDLELDEENRIYRLHICKKGDPVSTIIIGGQDENFVHLIMNKESNITLVENENYGGFQHSQIQGQSAKISLDNLFDLQKKLNTPPDLPSAQNRAFIKKQVLTDLQMMADTASNPVVRLLALHFIQESFASVDHLELMEKVHHDLFLAEYSSPYFDSFSRQLEFLQFQTEESLASGFDWLKWLGLIMLFVLLFLFWQLWKGRSSGIKDAATNKFQSLSNQERKVFHLLKKGKSNKEISSELHIEVSTVKSHLNKIYSRLGVKSRKEIVDREN